MLVVKLVKAVPPSPSGVEFLDHAASFLRECTALNAKRFPVMPRIVDSSIKVLDLSEVSVGGTDGCPPDIVVVSYHLAFPGMSSQHTSPSAAPLWKSFARIERLRFIRSESWIQHNPNLIAALHELAESVPDLLEKACRSIIESIEMGASIGIATGFPCISEEYGQVAQETDGLAGAIAIARAIGNTRLAIWVFVSFVSYVS